MNISGLIFAILVAFIMATGISTMIGGLPLAGRLWRWTGGQIRRQVTRIASWFWRNHRRELMGFLAGVLVTLFFLGRL